LQNSARLVHRSSQDYDPSQPRILLAIAKHRQLQRINLFQKIFRGHLTKKKAVIYSRTRDTWNLYKDKIKGQGVRLEMPPLDEMKRTVLDRLLDPTNGLPLKPRLD
jgi:hypothetical protein